MPYNLPTSVIHLEDFNNDAKCFLDSLTPKLDKTDYKYAHCYVYKKVLQLPKVKKIISQFAGSMAYLTFPVIKVYLVISNIIIL